MPTFQNPTTDATEASEALRGLAAAADALVTLDAALDEDPPAGFDEGGVIRPGFSPEIDSLRAMTRDARGFLLGLRLQPRRYQRR